MDTIDTEPTESRAYIYVRYSDGSSKYGGVGGAEVLMRGEEVIRRKWLHLASDKEHTVYEAELAGMVLAVQLLKEDGGMRGARWH